jgi:hypothetical protein
LREREEDELTKLGKEGAKMEELELVEKSSDEATDEIRGGMSE